MNVNATIIGQMITFIILIWFVMKYVWAPITAAMEARSKRIAEGLAASERGKQAMEAAEQRAQEAMVVARQKAAEVIAQAEKRAGEIIEQSKQSAREEGDRILAGARAEIDQEVYRAREGLRQQVAALAVAGAEKILRREINPQVHADLLDAIKNEI